MTNLNMKQMIKRSAYDEEEEYYWYTRYKEEEEEARDRWLETVLHNK